MSDVYSAKCAGQGCNFVFTFAKRPTKETEVICPSCKRRKTIKLKESVEHAVRTGENI